MSVPIRVLTVDVGTGTQDILLFESGKTIENCFKMVMPSPTVIVANRIKKATEQGRPVVLTGVTMGGGPSHWAARDHALAGYAVSVTVEAAKTFDDDLSMVRQMGFEIVGDDEASRRVEQDETVHVELQDFDAQAILQALRVFDVETRVDAIALAAFDHGAAPPGVSDRRFRFDFIAETVQRDPMPSAFAYMERDVPASLTRLRSVATSAKRYLQLSNSSMDVPLLLMDTGSAAALGALDDAHVREQNDCILCNVGNFHALAFHLLNGKIVGIFEHHTGELTRSQLEMFLVKLAKGTLTNEEIFSTSGHGALIVDEAASAGKFPFLAVTGPRRELLRGSELHSYEAVPHGDMMLAGNYGLLRALAQREPYLGQAILSSLLG